MRIKSCSDAHQNLRRCASKRVEMRRVSRSDAEASPFSFASLLVLVGFAAFFAGYLSLSYSGCFDRLTGFLVGGEGGGCTRACQFSTQSHYTGSGFYDILTAVFAVGIPALAECADVGKE